MSVNPEIFRAYDIRGIYPLELNEETAYIIGRAFVRFLGKKSLKIVVGRDNRLSSPSLFKNLVKGINAEGADVVDIGQSTSPMLYWACAHYKFDAGVQVSASHNPSQYNGFKFVGEEAFPISEKTGLRKIKQLTLSLSGKKNFKSSKKGRATRKSVLSGYIRFNLREFDLKKMKDFKIVIDTANAVPGIVVPEFFKKIKCRVYYLFLKLDGSFPGHPPSPHEGKNLKWLKKEVKKRKADLGIAFDGDGDRVIFVDERGRKIPGDLITALLIKLILQKNPGEKVLADVRSSNIVRDTIKENGGIAVLGRIGHSFIKEKMRKENIIFQGELNGHYYLKAHYFCEAPFYAIFKILEEMSGRDKSISRLVEPFERYFHSEEINFKVKNKRKVLGLLEKKFKNNGRLSRIDGLRIDFSRWWFNVRASNTEPVLRLVIEADTREMMEKKKEELMSLINSNS